MSFGGNNIKCGKKGKKEEEKGKNKEKIEIKINKSMYKVQKGKIGAKFKYWRIAGSRNLYLDPSGYINKERIITSCRS